MVMLATLIVPVTTVIAREPLMSGTAMANVRVWCEGSAELAAKPAPFSVKS